MSGPERIASALNRFARNGLNTMGGSDGEEMDRLLHEYFNCGEHEQEDPPGSKYGNYNKHNTMTITMNDNNNKLVF